MDEKNTRQEEVKTTRIRRCIGAWFYNVRELMLLAGVLICAFFLLYAVNGILIPRLTQRSLQERIAENPLVVLEVNPETDISEAEYLSNSSVQRHIWQEQWEQNMRAMSNLYELGGRRESPAESFADWLDATPQEEVALKNIFTEDMLKKLEDKISIYRSNQNKLVKDINAYNQMIFESGFPELQIKFPSKPSICY